MMEMMMPRRCARLMLALAFLAVTASAQASTIYNFTFTDTRRPDPVVGKGSFTTNGASADPGYDLVESLTFDKVTTSDGTVYTGAFAMTLTVGAAYNPATGKFINHYFGHTYEDIGLLTYERPDFQLVVYGDSFSRNLIPGTLSGYVRVPGDIPSLAYGQLAVTAATLPAVPEPTSLLFLGTGLLTVAGTRRRFRAR